MRAKSSIRNYMEFIRELSAQRGVVSVRDISNKHHISSDVSTTLSNMGWIIAKRRVGGRWIGPVPTNEADLRAHALKLKDASNAYKVKCMSKKPKSDAPVVHRWQYTGSFQAPKDEKKVPTPSQTLAGIQDHLEAIDAKPKASKRRTRKVSILWGFISWTR